ncbi:hypothetical protein SAMN05428642_101536 [Flaviramulus basaltis]|uniref:Uncharacterized protein n=1 Tax=Flaviramulus basaltis TaxID=369401 RepID=A0A1K2IBG7_9FLAO|nr:hypothetical protein [Flaviramulus basaltis]SFZ89743.1 hypothetical protein SAMN05428642_101536 [Flaviramulus basaltis]
MKFLLIFLSIVLIEKGCNQSKINQENISVEYTASSRGIYKQIIVDKKTISTLQKRGGIPTTKVCNETYWDNLIKVIKSINIDSISSLQAPSKAFQYDGAAIANLKITHNGKTHETPPFDHGNPPKKIAELVKEILSISENIE